MHTAPFLDSRGDVLPGSVASMEMVTIGDIEQSVWFRGRSTANPPLILLHGGPGASESALFRSFDAELEQHFLVIYWEQRGTGRSYHTDIPRASMTVAQMGRDLGELVDFVRRRFGHDKVVLLGHSWGTVLGTMYAFEHPEKVSAYVGVAQITDMARGARQSYEFALEQASLRGEEAAAAKIRAIGPSIDSVDERLALGRWVEHYGGMFHGGLSTGGLIWAALRTSETNLVDLIKFGQGNRFSLECLESETARLDLSQSHVRFRVPVVFMLGRFDRHVPSVLAEAYFQRIEAPAKTLVWFEASAHNPPFEEPDKFTRAMIDVVLPLAQSSVRAP